MRTSNHLSRPELIHGAQGVIPTLRNCCGYYDADEIGPVAPLVGYAGTYEDAATGRKLNFVGKKFYNFAMAEQWPFVLDHWAELVGSYFWPMGLRCNAFLGMPLGGLAFAQALSRAQVPSAATRYIYAEKVVTAVKTAEKREESILAMNRHVILAGEIVWLAEDVVNNYSTTDKGAGLVSNSRARMGGIVCVLNRSDKTEWNEKPVLSALHLPTEQFRQDDPQVEDKIRKGNVIWKPKDVWMQKICPRLAWTV